MKSLLTLALAVALTSTTVAQDSQRPAQPPRPPRVDRSVTGLTTTASSSPDWFSKTINVDIKNATLAEAIKKILEAADVKVTKIDDQLEPDKKNKLSLKLDGVNVRDALAAVSRLYAAQAFVLSEDGKTTIELKNRVAEAMVGSFSSAGPGSFPFGQAVGGDGGGLATSIFVTGNTERYKDLPEKKIDIKVQEGTALDVVKAICEKAGLDYELDKDLKGESKVSMTMTGVSVGNALDNAAGLLQCGWKAEKKGGKVKIYFGKKYPSQSLFGSFGSAGRVIPPIMPELPIVGNLFTRSASLPNKRVSLDKKSTDVRECLKEILQQVDLSYALADDLPSDPKSFTFSNVPLATALDMICESIEVGWTTEGSADGKPIVKVGKRYKGRSSSRSSFSSYTSMPTLSRYNGLAETYRAARPATPRVSLPAPRIPLECL